MAGMLIGALGNAAGELAYTILDFAGFATFPSIADVFFVVSAASVMFSLFYFWLRSLKPVHGLVLKDILVFIFVIGSTGAFLLTVFFGFPAPSGAILELVLNTFYPVSSAFMFAQVFLMKYYFEMSGLKHFFEYFADGIFIAYVGDMIFTYAEWANAQGVIVNVYSTFFFFGYALTAFAFYLQYRISK